MPGLMAALLCILTESLCVFSLRSTPSQSPIGSGGTLEDLGEDSMNLDESSKDLGENSSDLIEAQGPW